MRLIALLIGAFLLPIFANAERVRRVSMKPDQIARVRTALGVATIIQVPDSPTSLVVGDSEAFKVEFLENAITIKPLRRSAKSNLYIYTEYRRYDVQLVTESEPTADYVVYLLDERTLDRGRVLQKWKPLNLNLASGEFTLQTKRTSKTPVSAFLEFEVLGGSGRVFEPSWIWIVQRGNVVPIQRLVFSSFKATKDIPIRGFVEILTSDLNSNLGLKFELRRTKRSAIDLPKVDLW